MAVEIGDGAVRRAARLRRADVPPGRRGARGSTFSIELDRELPPRVDRDRRQAAAAGACKNLLSNAFKFTEHGKVELRIERADGRLDRRTRPEQRRSVIAFSVTDTGIGIPHDKQQIIFEAFQQADGTTQPQVRRHRPRAVDQPRDRRPARRQICASSRTPGQGSTFTLYLPLTYSRGRRRCTRTPHAAAAATDARRRPTTPAPAPCPPADGARDRASCGSQTSRRRLAAIIAARRPRAAHRRGRLRLRAHPARAGARPGFKGVVATRGEHGARAGARSTSPTRSRSTSACPTSTAGRARSAQARPARRATSRSTSISAVDDDQRARALRQARSAFLQKPVDRAATSTRAFDDMQGLRRAARQEPARRRGRRQCSARRSVELIGNGDVESTPVASGAEALRAAARAALRLHGARPGPARHARHRAHRDRSAATRSSTDLPIIVYTGRELTRAGGARAARASPTVIIKRRQVDGASARRDRALPPPRRGRTCPSQAPHA